MQSIRSAAALSKLLDDLGWFELSYCLSLSPPPGSPDMPDRVELVLRDEITASIDEDVRTFRMSRLTATGIRQWSFSGDEEFSHRSDYSVEYAELIDTPEGFGLAFDVPTLVSLVADAFEYERLPDEFEPMPIWIGTSFTVTVPQAGVPPPAQWVEAFAREGSEVTWRVFGGPAHPAEHVSSDYTGWFLERPSRISEHDQGIFVRYCGVDADGLTIGVDRHGADEKLWRTLGRVAASMFPEGDFHANSRRFTAKELVAHLDEVRDRE